MTFNKELMLRVREKIATVKPGQVDMDVVLKTRPCGTVGCIAGWTFREAGRAGRLEGLDYTGYVCPEAAALLGIDREEADYLFTFNDCEDSYNFSFDLRDLARDYEDANGKDDIDYGKRQLIVLQAIDRFIAFKDGQHA